MSRQLRIGLKTAGQDSPIDEIRAVWRIADEAGFDHLWSFDHLASIGSAGPDRPVFEGWALQAAMAQATTHVRIGCLVSGNLYRHPVLLAKLATTVDHLSGGRLEFGIGAGWAVAEQTMYGLDGLERRVGRLVEALRIIRSLWTEDRTTFVGRHYRLCDAIANPKPIQRPHPPIWIGGSGEQMLRVAARHADVWNPTGVRPGRGALGLSRRLDEACAAIGREPGSIRRSMQFPWDGASRDQLVEMVGRALEEGFTDQIVIPPAPTAARVAGQVAEALPDLRALAAPGAG